MTVRGCALLVVLGAAAAAGLPPAVRAQDAVDEYRVKAAYLLRFGDYVVWPDDFAPADPGKFVIGVVGKDPFGKEVLDHLTKRLIGDKKIVVRRFASVEEVKPCHILFLAAEAGGPESHLTAAQRLAELRKKLNGTPVLLVSDTTGLGRKGAMVNFYLEDNRARFEINPGEAKRAGLTVSSNLLKIGTLVTTDKE